jgi:hypothetical protein
LTFPGEAIRASSEIPSSVRVYVKGSYKNNTNVRQDADVDVCVEWTDFFYVSTRGKTAGMGPAELRYIATTHRTGTWSVSACSRRATLD